MAAGEPAFKVYGRAAVSEFLGDRIVYRSLEACEPGLPRYDAIRRAVGLPAGVPRKSEAAYARAVAYLLEQAQAQAGGQPLRKLIFIGDTHMNDATAFANLCQAGGWQGAAFIGCENDRPPENRIDQVEAGQTLFLANRWSALVEFDHFCSENGLGVNGGTAVVIDLDKTAIGARGRNAHVIDAVRVQAVRATVSSLLDGDFHPAGFQTAYDRLKLPEFHPFTRDNQDYLAYICLVIGTGLFDLEQVLDGIRSGALGSFEAFIAAVDRRSGDLGEHLAPVHQEIYALVQAGDPTPFKPFRRNEYLATVGRMGHLCDDVPVERLLEEEIVITQEVRSLALAWRERGALLFGLSDKPDEASCPTPDQAAQGFVPVHRVETHAVGEDRQRRAADHGYKS